MSRSESEQADVMLRTLAIVEAMMEQRSDDVALLLAVQSFGELMTIVLDLCRYAAGVTMTLMDVTKMEQDAVLGWVRAALVERAGGES